MKKSISIPKPCTENWGQMTSTERGRVCDKCATTVIDFTQMSVEGIRNFLKNKSGKVCAAMTTNQLRLSKGQMPEKLKYFIYVLLLTFFPHFFSEARSLPFDTFPNTILPHQPQLETGGVDGKLTNKQGTPLAFASVKAVVANDTIISSKTDENGNYKLKPMKGGVYTIVFQYGDSTLTLQNVEIKPGNMFTQNAIISKQNETIELPTYKKEKQTKEPITIGQVQYESLDHIFKGPYPWTEMIKKTYPFYD